jgi:hypothetical protein
MKGIGRITATFLRIKARNSAQDKTSIAKTCHKPIINYQKIIPDNNQAFCQLFD